MIGIFINSTKELRINTSLSLTAINKVAKDAGFDSLPNCLVCADTGLSLGRGSLLRLNVLD